MGISARWNLSRRRGLNEGERRETIAVMGVFRSCCGPCGDGAHSIKIWRRGGEGAMPPRSYDRLGVAGSGCGSSAITPLCPFSVALSRGVLPSLSNLLGLTSSRPRRIFTTPSCPFQAAQYSAVRPWILGLSGLTSSR